MHEKNIYLTNAMLDFFFIQTGHFIKLYSLTEFTMSRRAMWHNSCALYNLNLKIRRQQCHLYNTVPTVFFSGCFKINCEAIQVETHLYVFISNIHSIFFAHCYLLVTQNLMKIMISSLLKVLIHIVRV